MESNTRGNSACSGAGVDLDIDTIDSFVRDRIPDLEGAARLHRVQGGQSNPTYIIAYDNRKLVLRRRPDGKLLPSAHAVGREFFVQKALWPTPVAVPRMILHCTDPAVAGTEFYLMEHVEGRIFHQDSLPGVERRDKRPMLFNLAEMLARIHSVDIAACGLGRFGRHGSYFQRQTRRWSGQWRLSKGRELDDMDRLLHWLPDNIPEDDSTTIVHGDYRSGNVIYHPTEPTVLAVLDWELSTLGHPMADLAHSCAYIWMMGDLQANIMGASSVSAAIEGLTMPEFVDAYCRMAATEHRLTNFHLAFALFRNAAIYEGVADRARRGNAAAANAASLGRVVPILARRAVAMTTAGEDFMSIAQSHSSAGQPNGL
ncbi:MAG: phosphotransferase family protein [Rhodobacteraceae bacterium]|nr:phosphotransferase family protein [Paracoccaceae bacterium]